VRQLQVPTSWVLEGETARDRSPFCIDIECPEVSRRWRIPSGVATRDLARLMESAGWHEVRADGDCQVRDGTTDPLLRCAVTADAAGYDATLSITGPHASESGAQTDMATLSIRP
jgi:hypothetical protein